MRKREARQRKDTSEWEVGKTRRKEGIAKSEKGREEKGNRERTTTAVFGEGRTRPGLVSCESGHSDSNERSLGNPAAQWEAHEWVAAEQRQRMNERSRAGSSRSEGRREGLAGGLALGWCASSSCGGVGSEGIESGI